MKVRRIPAAALCAMLLFSCSLAPAPEQIRLRAWEEAEKYLGMEYEWGGQDFYKGIDCSGLVVNCYLRAIEGTPYFLRFHDATVKTLHQWYTEPVDEPDRGDLIFMGDDGITHVAVFGEFTGGDVRFIDAYSETGLVELRSYPADDPRIKQFGRIILGLYW